MSEESQIALDHRQLNQAQVIQGQFLVTRGQGATFFEPAHAPLDHIAAPVVVGVVRHGPSWPRLAAVLLRWDHRDDPMAAQPLADAQGAVRAIGGHAFRPPAGSPLALGHLHTVQRGLELGRLVRLAGQEQGGEWESSPVAEHMHFRAEAAP